MKYFRRNMHVALALSVAAMLIIFFERLPTEKETAGNNSQPLFSKTQPRKTPLAPKLSKSKATKSFVNEEVNPSPESRLKRFDAIQDKVLLNDKETSEKEQSLSDPKLIDWVASQLMKGNVKTELKARLSLIDYLEEAVTWRDNPSRETALTAISNVILSEKFLDASREEKRQLVGDKIELFTIFSEEAPEKISELRARVLGTKIEGILNYAEKRLPLTQPEAGGPQ